MWLLLLWLACVGPTPQQEPLPQLPLIDADGDGYPADVDCDDENPAVHPAAEERCNGIDDDCSPTTVEVTSMAMIPTVGAAEVLLCAPVMSGNLLLKDANLLIRSNMNTILLPADDRRPLIQLQGGSLGMVGVKLSGVHDVGYPGESLLLVSRGELRLREVEIVGGRSPRGAGIRAHDGARVVIESSEFRDNQTIGDGGAISVTNAELRISGSAFYNDFAQRFGGAIEAEASQVVLRDVEFEQNRSNNKGGAVYLFASDLTGSMVRLDENHASRSGGALHADNSHVFLSDVAFSRNGTMERGGAASAIDSFLRLEAVDFSHNYAGPEGQGGALNASGTHIEGAWVRLRQNQTLPRGSGGAMRLDESTVGAIDWTFVSNVAGARAGALDLVDSDFDGDGGTLFLRNAAAEGGAAWITGSTLRAGRLIGNGAQRGGAAMLVGTLSVLEADVVGNLANEHGGGLYVVSQDARFDGALRGNLAEEGGGAWLTTGAHLVGNIDWSDVPDDNTPDDLASHSGSWSSGDAGEWVCQPSGCVNP